MTQIPVIDVSPLRAGRGLENAVDAVDAVDAVARLLDDACRDTGFFCIVGHGVDEQLMEALDRSARDFFALPVAAKAEVAMAVGGRAWRGWFPLGGELTSGVPDRKEGFYFGAELDEHHPRSGLALHGRNLFPRQVPALRSAVLAWLDALTELAHTVMGGIALGLGLEREWFRHNLTGDPTILFRIFRYPPDGPSAELGDWGVAEHTDYGILTLLLQDDCGGLQVKSTSGWIDVPPLPNSFVCNIGDMLERMTGGRYRSTPHRVLNTSGRERLSFPFFFDPSWDAHVEPLPLAAAAVDEAPQRWDGASVFDFDGIYGDYLTAKVGKVFPDLIRLI